MTSLQRILVLAIVLSCIFSVVVSHRVFPAPSNTLVNDAELINRINTNSSHGWKAHPHSQFHNKTIGEIRQMLGLSFELNEQDIPREEAPTNAQARITIPATFDSRTQWSNCVFAIRNQQSCGACWAFSSAMALGHRLCVATNAAKKVVLSPDYMVRCDTANMACKGGYLKYAWTFLEKTGTPTEACVPYTSGSGTVASCPSSCTDGSTFVTYKAKNTKFLSGVSTIQQSIMTYGHVQAGFSIYRDFLTYKSGVYKHVSTTSLGGHAIQLIGWGTENGQAYWLAANQWGTSWGDAGYFKIARGTNECGIESQVYAGEAVVA